MTAAAGPSPQRAPGEPRVSVVVATFDRPARLDRLLGALAAQTVPGAEFEVIVADDGGRDATAQVLDRWAASEAPRVRAVASHGSGPAVARNAALRLARSPFVAFTDDDCEPAPNWLAALLEAAATAPGALVQGRTEPQRDELRAAKGLVRTKSISTLGPWFQTCNMLYPRAVLEEVGGFDERFTGPLGEDVDLAWRAIEAGAATAHAEAALVFHAVEPISPGEFLRSALRDPDEALVFRRHAALRRTVARLGIFKAESHALLAVAIGAALAARRTRAAALLALPYARLIAARTRDPGHGFATAPLLVAYDLLETAAAARGAVRHRVLAL